MTKASITRDLEQMKAKGFGGAVIFDGAGADQDGNERVPHGPTFFSAQWRELYKHALAEADRLGLEIVVVTGKFKPIEISERVSAKAALAIA